MRGEDVTAKWATESGFREPVIAVDKAGMGLKVTMVDASIAAVAHTIGVRVSYTWYTVAVSPIFVLYGNAYMHVRTASALALQNGRPDWLNRA